MNVLRKSLFYFLFRTFSLLLYFLCFRGYLEYLHRPCRVRCLWSVPRQVSVAVPCLQTNPYSNTKARKWGRIIFLIGVGKHIFSLFHVPRYYQCCVTFFHYSSFGSDGPPIPRFVNGVKGGVSRSSLFSFGTIKSVARERERDVVVGHILKKNTLQTAVRRRDVHCHGYL